MSLADRTPPTTEEFRAYRERFSNWGRWGEDDQFGALNLITPEVRAAAAATVRDGRSVSLSYPLAMEPGPENPEPVQHEMRLDDELIMAFAHPEFLVSTDWLAEHLADDDVRVFETTVFLRPRDGGGYRVESGRVAYESGHIRGAGFLDLQRDFSDNDQQLRSVSI